VPPNQISGATARTPGICSIFCRSARGRKFARPEKCCTTMREAPSVPMVVSPVSASRSEESTTIRKSTRMIEVIVR